MSRLLYHDLTDVAGQTSPFDEAALEVAASGPIGIVSPYIGIDYLQRVIQVSGGWRLVSDIEAWLSSLPMRARPKAWLFIRENLDSIHHCPAIHAKAVIGHKLATFGSANLTNTGILGRTEMGILLDDETLVAELCGWFETLWQQTAPPIADETNAFIQWLDEEAERAPVRREKFSLSASGKKIRARLVKLPIPATHGQPSATLKLEEVAQTLILKEQQHYASLEEALESAINSLANDGFVFGQIVGNVRQAFAAASVREIYFELLQHCANHVRSVFAENTRNRLILEKGLFTQSTKELLAQALAPFDAFLVLMVRHFEFKETRDMPDEDRLEALTGLRGGDQVILISELLDCGFLELEDIAGQLPQYSLSEDFMWDGRYKLFPRAMHDWNAKKNWSEMQVEPSLEESSKEQSGDEYLVAVTGIVGGYDLPDYLDEYVDHDEYPLNETRGLVGSDKMKLSTFLRIEQAKAKRAENLRKEKLAQRQLTAGGKKENEESVCATVKPEPVEPEKVNTGKQQNRREGIDAILSNLLRRLLSGETLPHWKDLLERLPTELGVEPKWVKEVVYGGAWDLPKVIVITNDSVSINPHFDWKDLNDYPLTLDVCKSFLKM